MHGLTLVLSVIILAAAYFGPYRRPAFTSVTFAAVLLALGLLTSGGAEWVREGIRKPYVIYDYLYSNGIFAGQAKDPRGIMATAVWSVYGSVQAAPTPVHAGEDLFRLQCASCHTVDGYNGVRPLVRGWTADFAAHQIDRLNMLKGYMPPWLGTDEERDALPAWLGMASLSAGAVLLGVQRHLTREAMLAPFVNPGADWKLQPQWDVFAIFAVLLVGTLGLVGYLVARFFREARAEESHLARSAD